MNPLIEARPDAIAAAPDQLAVVWIDHVGVAHKSDKTAFQALSDASKPGGPDLAPPQVIAGGGVEFAVDWLLGALSARGKGVPMVNIAQSFARAGGLITCWKVPGKTKPEEYFTGGKGVGYLEPKDFDQTVDILLSGGSTPVITRKPENAWTHTVWDKAITEVK